MYEKDSFKKRNGLIIAYFLSAFTFNYFYIEINFIYSFLLSIAELLIMLPFIKYRKEKESRNSIKFKSNFMNKWKKNKENKNKENDKLNK